MQACKRTSTGMWPFSLLTSLTVSQIWSRAHPGPTCRVSLDSQLNPLQPQLPPPPPPHCLLTSTVLQNPVKDTEGRGSWGFRNLLPPLGRKIIHACVNVTSFAGQALSGFSVSTLSAGSACSCPGSALSLREEWTPPRAAELSQHRRAFLGFPSPGGH